MVMVARARNLPSSAADLLESEAKKIFKKSQDDSHEISTSDPLLQWFDNRSALTIRNIEQRARKLLLHNDLSSQNMELNRYSCLASNLYVALFNACRILTKPFRSSNPTWLRLPKDSEVKLEISASELLAAVSFQIANIAKGLRLSNLEEITSAHSSIFVGDSTSFVKESSVDLILTSPPYCTRIDYTAATRVELALIAPMLSLSREELSRDMVGSVRVPKAVSEPQVYWGETCNNFIAALRSHSSKASSGYYYKTHIDYFDKMSRSMKKLYKNLKNGGGAVMVVQDSFYKDIHNDVPTILTEMAQLEGLNMYRRVDFLQRNSISGINSKSRKYSKPAGPIETVICFLKN